MKLSEYRQLVSSLSDEQKTAMLIDLYKRQDKGGKILVETIAECLKDKKDLPEMKAYIPKFTVVNKEVAKFREWVLISSGWYYTRNSRKHKAMGRSILKEISTVPPQAKEAYLHALEIEKEMFDLCCLSESREFPWMNAFEMLGTTRSDRYRRICQMSFENGYSVDVIRELITFTCSGYYTDLFEVLEELEIFCTFLKNGDLRFEVLELCENMFRQLGCPLPANRASFDENHKTHILYGLAVLYMLLDSQETDESTAKEDLENLTSPAFLRRFYPALVASRKALDLRYM